MSKTFNPYAAPESLFTEVQSELDEIELATIGQRVLARIIDALILGFASIVLALIVIVVAFLVGALSLPQLEAIAGGTFSVQVEDDYSLFSLNLFDPILYIGIVITHGLFLALHGVFLHRFGQTIGKRILKIAMVDADTYEIVPLPRLFVLRYLIWDIPALFYPLVNWIIRIVDLAFGLREDRRTLHDMTANTIVIKVAHAPNYNAPTLDRLARKAQSRGTRKVV